MTLCFYFYYRKVEKFMEKSQKIFKIIREIFVSIAPFVLLACFPIQMIVEYVGRNNNIDLGVYIVGLIGCGLMVVFFAMHFLVILFDRLKSIREKSKSEKIEMLTNDVCVNKTENENSFRKTFSKCLNWCKNNFYIFRLAASVLCMVGFAIPFFSMFCGVTFIGVYRFIYWAMLTMFIFSIVETCNSKDKKTLIAMIITDIILAVSIGFVSREIYLIINDVFYAATIPINAWMSVWALFSILPMRVAMADGEIIKSKRSRNFCLGFFSLAGGIILHYVPSVAKTMNESYAGVAIQQRLHNIGRAMNGMWWIFSALLLVMVVNFSINIKAYIKNKNILGLLDLVANIIAIVLSILAIINLQGYMIWLGR